MYAAHGVGCGPIVTMIKNDTDVLVPVRPNTIAKSLAIGNPADGKLRLQGPKESGGPASMPLTRRSSRHAAAGPHRRHLTETRAASRSPRPKADRARVIPRDESIVLCIRAKAEDARFPAGIASKPR